MWIGSWSSEWLSSLSTGLTMPYVNGMIVMIAVALLAALIVRLLQIRSALIAVLAGDVLMCFPTVSDTLGFLHNADAYMLAAMLSVLGFVLLERCRWGFVLAVLLIALGTGTYQACASLVIGLMFVRGVQLLADRLPDAAQKWKKGLSGIAALCSWVLVLGLAACAFRWSVDANVIFYEAALDYEKMYAQCTEFVGIAEEHEDYMGGMPILVIGDISYNELRDPPELNETKSYYAFMEQILGVRMPYGVANDIRDKARAIMDTEDFVVMSCYPDEDSVMVIDDCLIIKLSEEMQ